ncbi:MAG TPA: hypothetical protein VLT36_11645 [Candidatus Dormibacteraeota bacterium]|nr:hypothetical protein [Candidatus Dormibacteraeota bacterium]
MKIRSFQAGCTLAGIGLLGMANPAFAGLELLPPSEPPSIFAGSSKAIPLLWRNGGDEILTSNLHFRMYQASSATAMPFMEAPWKQLTVLPGQTVVESARLDFPTIKTETRFIVQWLDPTNRALGNSEVDVFPARLLSGLSTLAAPEGMGVYDPGNCMKPVLKDAGVDVVDLQQFAAFEGRLALFVPSSALTEPGEDVIERVKGLAKTTAAIVWIVPPRVPPAPLQPTFAILTLRKASIVLAQSSLVTNLAEDPRAQLKLVELARLALHPAPPFPEFPRKLSASIPLENQQ